MNTETDHKLTSPWQLLRDIASWLPDRDERRALAIVEHHENQHQAAERRAAIQGAD